MPKELKVQHYFTLLVLVTVVALISVAEWTQSQKSATEQRENFYSNLSSESASFEHFVKSRVDSLRNELAQTASRHTDTSPSLTSESPFTAMAWLKKNPSGASSKYKAVWAEANSQTFDPTWLKGLNFSQVKDGETLFVRRVDRNGTPFFALVTTAVAQGTSQGSSFPEDTNSEGVDDRVYLFGAVTAASLNSWADEYVGSTRTAAVFDENGNVISHSQRQYSNTNLSTDKLVSSAVRSGRSKVTLEFSDLEGEGRVGESLKITGTNLRAALTVPKSAMFKAPVSSNSSQRGMMILMGLILVAAAHLASRRWAPKLAKNSNAQPLSPRITEVPQLAALPVEEIAQPEKELTFEEVELKTKANLDEILARSAEIRKRLQIDFIESVEEEQKLFFKQLEADKQIEVDNLIEQEKLAEVAPTPKVKIRRPKVSL